MLGWMLIFALMVLSGTILTLGGGSEMGFGMALTLVSGFLLVVSAFTVLLRRRA